MGKILLVAPTWVNLHKDILEGLKEMGYYVEFIPEYSFKGDPLRIKAKGVVMKTEVAELTKSTYWSKQLEKTVTVFDYLLVIDGQGVNQFLFFELKKRNPNIYCINYLYDTTYSMYHFDENFHFYQKIFTFDKKDAAQFQLILLPIYWLNNQNSVAEGLKYDVFGLGAYSDNRYRLFQQVKTIAEEMEKKSYIRLYAPPVRNLLMQKVKNAIKFIIGRHDYIPLKLYKSKLITTDLISTEDFRCYVQMSDVILDTKVLNQSGLTARFMWALGAGKKIITTNDAIKTYEFYDPGQILVVEDHVFTESDKKRVSSFINSTYTMTKEQKKILEPYRLDNWLRTILYH